MNTASARRPLVHKIWTLDEQRPIAPVEHRFVWRYLLGFVHPASGRTIFHLATGVSLALFETELQAFATQVGAGPGKQIVLILDRAGWHASVRLRVPEHIHLLFLPPYSPELQPAEHLWPFTNTVLINRHFVSIHELGDVQAARVVELGPIRPIHERSSSMVTPFTLAMAGWTARSTSRLVRNSVAGDTSAIKEWLRERSADSAVLGAITNALAHLPSLQNLQARSNAVSDLYTLQIRSRVE